MSLDHDTIIAIATPEGRGGIGVLRLSGPGSREIASGLVENPERLGPRHAAFTRLVVGDSRQRRAIDQAVVTFFPGPGSYTGEDVVEIAAHGSPVLLRDVLNAALGRGARLAAPGEFTLRAFLNGRIDLVQAEAVNDLIAAATPLQARAAFDQLDGTLTARIAEIDELLLELVSRLEASLDFPEEGYHFIDAPEVAERIGEVDERVRMLAAEGRRGRLLREGITVAIVGRPNVGKSSLFNQLAGADRAIVTETPGTTRDLITERVDVNGLAVTFVDTAGLRAASDLIEAEGVRRAQGSVDAAQVVVVTLDGSEPLEAGDVALLQRTHTRARVVVANKSDLPAAWSDTSVPDDTAILRVSAARGTGIDALRDALVTVAGGSTVAESAVITNVRHLALLDRVGAALARAGGAASNRAYEELVLADLHEARAALEEVTGKRSSDDLLHEIFSRFCIGK